MGLMDKVKQVAGEAAEVAKKGASQVQTKVEQAQLRRRADEAAKQLGYLFYRERRGGQPAGQDADRLVDEIKTAEDELAEAQRQEAEQAAQTSSTGVETTPPASSTSGPTTSAGPSATTSASSGSTMEGPEIPPPAPTVQAPEEATGE